MGDVKLEHVTKQYDDVTAVDDMNVEIHDGEFICLVGPSGCGKSTTMEMIAGLTIPSEGKVSIAGHDVTNLPPKDRGIAMVFQNIALFPHMDVYDNISFGLRLRDYDKEEIDRRVQKASDIVQLEGMLDRMPDEMSGGQRQRVAIARAIVRNPEVFLMDEPLANLDAKLRVHMRTELQRLHKELDTTIIYVTHDQAEAMTMSDRIAVIDSGQLQQIDPPLVCYNEPKNLFVAGFIGSPSMNFIEGEVTESGFTSKNFDIEFDPAQMGVNVGDEVTLGIRPEDVFPIDEGRSISHPTAEISAVSDVLEPMGDEIFIYLMLDEDADMNMTQTASNSQLLMSVDPDSDISEDEDVEVVLDRSKIHLFDTNNGDAIQHGLVKPTTPESTTQTEAESDD
ncbi:multiple sugar transport system ATP-binding protein [Halogranum gelatinilyticum]|uniref:ABC-type D-xylose/L-arabinose transporter n=1 Tax=Halogranum gelatinilyticum TaxID=660521 RepID=A0A1G9T6A6_9EURY|nr:ABC transporter ATP-binding protein [Halogranum gelatinilyticum]SDM43254.1 multiple sugar transport system ATP-binding protein [Halogranum gelatinilyticum]